MEYNRRLLNLLDLVRRARQSLGLVPTDQVLSDSTCRDTDRRDVDEEGRQTEVFINTFGVQ